jgi:ATP-dependent RNA helicase DDX47/RRP3
MCFVGSQRLVQQYLFIPAKYKDCYVAYIVDEFKGQSVIIFVATCNNAQRATVSSAYTPLGYPAFGDGAYTLSCS